MFRKALRQRKGRCSVHGPWHANVDNASVDPVIVPEGRAVQPRNERLLEHVLEVVAELRVCEAQRRQDVSRAGFDDCVVGGQGELQSSAAKDVDRHPHLAPRLAQHAKELDGSLQLQGIHHVRRPPWRLVLLLL